MGSRYRAPEMAPTKTIDPDRPAGPRATKTRARAMAAQAATAQYLPPPLAGKSNGYDRRAVELDRAATEWLRASGKRGRPNYDRNTGREYVGPARIHGRRPTTTV